LKEHEGLERPIGGRRSHISNTTNRIVRRSNRGAQGKGSGARRLRSPIQVRREVEHSFRKVAANYGNARECAKIYAQAIKLLRPSGTPLLTAVTQYAKAIKILRGHTVVEAAREFARHNLSKHRTRTVRQVADELMALKTRQEIGGRSLANWRGRLDKISDTFAGNVAEVTTANIQRWLKRAKGAQETLKSLREAANALFKFAESRGYIGRGKNPVTATQIVGVPERDAITICTPNELRRLLVAAPGWFRPVLAMQAFAGLRGAEVLRLDWHDVKFDCGHIQIGTMRNNGVAKRLAPIPPNLVRWLADARKSSGNVFPYSRLNFDEVQTGTAAAAEIEWNDDALRHSFISYRVAQTSDVPRVSLESGASPGLIFKHYRTLVSEMDAREWFTIAQ
jgi:integrase